MGTLLFMIAPAVIALLAGCLQDPTAQSGTPVTIRAEIDETGLRFTVESDDLPAGAQVSVTGGNQEQAFVDAQTLSQDSQVLPALPVAAGQTYQVRVVSGGRELSTRNGVVKDLAFDDVPQLGREKLGAAYRLAYRHEEASGAFAENHTGRENIHVDRHGQTVRVFYGNGRLNETLGTIQVSLDLNFVERTSLNGSLTQFTRKGAGTWRLAEPGAGNGSVVSFRQDYLGRETLRLTDGQTRAARKEGITAELRGTVFVDGAARTVNQTVLWTKWTDAATGEPIQVRQRPAKLASASWETFERTGKEGVVPFSLPTSFQGHTIHPPQAGDAFLVRAFDGPSLRLEVGPGEDMTIGSQRFSTSAWRADPPSRMQFHAAADAGSLTGLPLALHYEGEHAGANVLVDLAMTVLKNLG